MKLRFLPPSRSGTVRSDHHSDGDRHLHWRQRLHGWRLEQKIGAGYLLAISIAIAGSLTGLAVSDYVQGRKITQIIDAQLQVRLLQDYEQAAQAVQVYGLRLLLDNRTPEQLQIIEDCLERSLQKAEDRTRQLQKLAVGDRSWFVANTQYENELQQLLQGPPSPLADTPENLSAFFQHYTETLRRYIERVNLDVSAAPKPAEPALMAYASSRLAGSQESVAGFTPLSKTAFGLASVPHADSAPTDSNIPTPTQLNTVNSDMLHELDALNQTLQQLIQTARLQELQAAQLIEDIQGLEKLIIIGSLLAAAMLAGVLAWRTTRAITQPIEAVVQVAQQAALNQDYDLRASVRSKDEISVLAIALNQLIESVAERTQALQDSAEAAEDQAAALASTLTTLHKTQIQLVQTEKMSSLGQLLAGVAHEINNPVNFIHGNVEYARQYVEQLFQAIAIYESAAPALSASDQAILKAIELDFIKDDLPKLLRSIANGSERINSLVLSLRIFSRLNEAEVKRVDLHQGLDSTLEILGHRLKAQANRPDIHLIKTYGDRLEAECNGGQMNQVFMNILTNAIDALDDEWNNRQRDPCSNSSSQPSLPQSLPQSGLAWHPTIEIATRHYRSASLFDPTSELDPASASSDPAVEWIDIQICNNGSAIPNLVLSRIFDPFFSTKAIGKGTGLGLSISYDIIVGKHQGRFLIASNEDGRVIFQIQIPVRFRDLARDRAVADRPSDRTSDQAPGQ